MRLILVPAMLVALAAASPTRAAQSYDSCAGFIDSVPATLTTQGVWCLRGDLSTSISSGNAITVAVNNVTIDCNDFKLGGLAAGAASQANGVYSDRLNTTVRNCNIRGFYQGVLIFGGGGALVESNRFDGNLLVGIQVQGAGSAVRDNRVFDTGGSTVITSAAYGISVALGTDVVGNTVANVSATGDPSSTFGISTTSNGSGSIRNNLVKGLMITGPSSDAYGIANFGASRVHIRDNDVQGLGTGASTGIICASNQATAFGNIVSGMSNPIFMCAQSGNYINAN